MSSHSFFLLFFHLIIASAMNETGTGNYTYLHPRHPLSNTTAPRSTKCCFTLFATPFGYEVILPNLQSPTAQLPVHQNSTTGSMYIDTTLTSPDPQAQFCSSATTGPSMTTADDRTCIIEAGTSRLTCSIQRNETSNATIASTSMNFEISPKNRVILNDQVMFSACPTFNMNTTFMGSWTLHTQQKFHPQGCFNIMLTSAGYTCAAKGVPDNHTDIAAATAPTKSFQTSIIRQTDNVVAVSPFLIPSTSAPSSH